jgi:hypothetical protein
MTTAPLIFDIETGPLPIDMLKQIVRPFDRSSIKNPGVFDPNSVKYGRTTDPAKRAAKLKEVQEKHEKAVEDYESNLEAAEEKYWLEVQDKAALSAITGQVLAIGYGGNGETVDHGMSEEELLSRFWAKFKKCRETRRKMIGFNIKKFDVPFIVQRSFILAVDVPESYMDGRYLSATFVDLNDAWMCGNYGYSGNLDEIARACGVGRKTEGVSGAHFAELYSNEATRPQAIDYALNDVVITRAVANRISVCS